MYDLVDAVRAWREEGLDVAIIRPVDAFGFGARWPGEALAVASDGRRLGTVLGGAVDDQALPIAQSVVAGRRTSPVRIDVPVDAHGAASCGLSCSGEAHVLVQDAAAIPDTAWAAFAEGRPVALVTQIDAPGSSTLADEARVRALISRRPTGRSDGRFVTTDAGAVVAVEWWVPHGRLLITGAEGLATALVAQASLLGWDAQALPAAAAAEAAAGAGPADAVVVVSHDPEIDTPVLVAALSGRAGYVGAIGSRGTQVDRARRLAIEGIDETAAARIHGPVGLDLGGADVGGYGAGLVLFRMGDHGAWVRWFSEAVSGAGRAQRELVASVERLQREWGERLAAPRDGARRLRSNAAAWRVIDLLPRWLVLTGPAVAAELDLPLKSASAALRDLVAAGVLVEQGTVQRGVGRPSRLYVSAELLGLAGSSPLRA